MNDYEIIGKTVFYMLGVLGVVAAAGLYGWHLRERLALKLEHFAITDRQWKQYDEALKQRKAPAQIAAVPTLFDRGGEN